MEGPWVKSELGGCWLLRGGWRGGEGGRGGGILGWLRREKWVPECWI